MDQGATQALPILSAQTRHIAGLVEVTLAKTLADKTNWRAILKGNADAVDLRALATQSLAAISDELDALRHAHGEAAFERLDEDVVEINYPVTRYPTKITSLNFDKKPVVTGTLEGIKGQYLIFDSGVINMRKFTGYEISAET